MVERRAVEHGAAVRDGRAEHVLGEMGILHHRRRAVQQIEHDRDGKVVRHRQDPHDAIRRPDAQAAVRSGHALQQALVRDHDAFARPGRAGAEPDECGIERRELRLIERQFVADRDLAHLAAFSDDRAHARLADHPLALGRREFAGDGHETFSRAHDGQREHDVGDAVRTIEPHARSPDRADPRSRGVAHFEEPPIRNLLARADERGRAAVGVLEDAFDDVHVVKRARAARTEAASQCPVSA